jgi:glycosyltransferase involved in cell wall biosynthesis
MLKILYDGWSISHHPDSPAAMHLLTLLACCPSGVQSFVALPAAAPPWLPAHAAAHIQPCTDSPRDHLRWEQRILPQIAGQLGAHLLHLVAPSPPLFGRSIAVVSPAKTDQGATVGGSPLFFDRLRDSASLGGMTRLRALLWPEDIPVLLDGLLLPREGIEVLTLPPVVHPEFLQPGLADLSGLDLPEGYVLYHRQGREAALRRLFEIWSWAAGSIGDYYPLVLLGLDETDRTSADRLAREYSVEESVRSLPSLSPGQVAAVYRGCSMLLHPGRVAPWGDPLRLALASGLPVVAAEHALADALVGPAAYLAPAGDSRALGAALITVLVEEELAGRLSHAARRRAEAWKVDRFPGKLEETYRQILSA